MNEGNGVPQGETERDGADVAPARPARGASTEGDFELADPAPPPPAHGSGAPVTGPDEPVAGAQEAGAVLPGVRDPGGDATGRPEGPVRPVAGESEAPAPEAAAVPFGQGAGEPVGGATVPGSAASATERPRPLHDPDPYSTPPYGRPGPWAPAPPVQHPANRTAAVPAPAGPPPAAPPAATVLPLEAPPAGPSPA
ncbi:hypothetical protein ACWC21_25670, partial [Streptomyces sp. NPDC001348]